MNAEELRADVPTDSISHALIDVGARVDYVAERLRQDVKWLSERAALHAAEHAIASVGALADTLTAIHDACIGAAMRCAMDEGERRLPMAPGDFIRRRCPDCGGTGRVIGAICATCEGDGHA